MPNARLPVNHAREILRLSREMKMSGRAIAKSLSLSTSTISKYLKQLEPVPRPLPEPGSEAFLAKVLEKKKAPTPSSRVEPDWDQVHRELQSHKGVTLLLLWEEYRETVQERGYSYSRFCLHYAAYQKRLKPSFRNTYTPGDRLFIDYAGSTVPIRDPQTGEVAQDAQIFVAVLGFSNYVFAEATSSQELSCWIGSHVRCFEFLGGVPALLVPDNLKSGITTPDLYEPLANETYRERKSTTPWRSSRRASSLPRTSRGFHTASCAGEGTVISRGRVGRGKRTRTLFPTSGERFVTHSFQGSRTPSRTVFRS